MAFPLFIIGGGAGSGKDTAAEMMVERRGGVMIAQADPMKRFAQAGFDFTTVQLWGPSDSRNAPDDRYALMKGGKLAFEKAKDRIFYSGLAEEWLREIGAVQAYKHLERWFDKLQEDYLVDNKVLTPRATLQLLGTEFGRAVSPDIWSHYALNCAGALLRGGVGYDKTLGVFPDKSNPGHRLAVITDGRFRNEILNVVSNGGRAIKIVNPAPPDDTVEKAGVAGHVSESELKGIPDEWYDFTIENDKSKGLNHLADLVSDMMVGFGYKPRRKDI